MVGNLWEWCNDWYAPHYYGVSPELDPIGPDQGEERVKRGGDYVAGVAFEVCVHNRLSTDPKMHGWADGFRCVKDVGSDSR
jgi:formylglycine-generating enzyme required for sulfatase activity